MLDDIQDVRRHLVSSSLASVLANLVAGNTLWSLGFEKNLLRLPHKAALLQKRHKQEEELVSDCTNSIRLLICISKKVRPFASELYNHSCSA